MQIGSVRVYLISVRLQKLPIKQLIMLGMSRTTIFGLD